MTNPKPSNEENKLLPKSTERAKQFRQRLADDQLRRWEIFVSDKTRDEVKEIAKIEGISPGITAQSLLALGVESYKQHQAGATTARHVVSEPSAMIGLNQVFASASAIGSSPSSLMGAMGSSSSLASYSSRVDERRIESKRNEVAPSNAISNFFNRVKSPKP